jgi:hypothetical protein
MLLLVSWMVSHFNMSASEPIEQNSMYSGYHSNTVINNTFAYGLDCKVFLYATSFPCCWHGGSITANILPYIQHNIGSYKMCADQGFPQGGGIH